MAVLTNAERQRRWRERQRKPEPFDRAEQLRQARADLARYRYLRPVTQQSASKNIEAPSVALVAAFDREWPRFANYAKAHVYGASAKQDAEDTASEVRARFLEQGGRIRSAKNVKAWMYRVLKSLLADRGRAADKQYELIGEVRREHREEFAEAGLRVTQKPSEQDENRDDEPIDRDDRKVELSKPERNETDAETIDRQDNPYYLPDDEEVEARRERAAARLLRRSPSTDPLILGSLDILARQVFPLPSRRTGPVTEPGGRFRSIQDYVLMLEYRRRNGENGWGGNTSTEKRNSQED
jgi:DNA-directed RNA polymerase specialized sigma24 family protein